MNSSLTVFLIPFLCLLQVLVLPSFWLSYLMYLSATGPTQTYAALVYGAVLTGLFTVSTVFHCVASVTNEG